MEFKCARFAVYLSSNFLEENFEIEQLYEETEEASQNADDMGQTQNDERDNENIDPELL